MEGWCITLNTGSIRDRKTSAKVLLTAIGESWKVLLELTPWKSPGLSKPDEKVIWLSSLAVLSGQSFVYKLISICRQNGLRSQLSNSSNYFIPEWSLKVLPSPLEKRFESCYTRSQVAVTICWRRIFTHATLPAWQTRSHYRLAHSTLELTVWARIQFIAALLSLGA